MFRVQQYAVQQPEGEKVLFTDYLVNAVELFRGVAGPVESLGRPGHMDAFQRAARCEGEATLGLGALQQKHRTV